MVAGEYAVLEPNYPLIVTAVDRFVYAIIKESNQNFLTLKDFGLRNIRWDYDHNELYIRSDDERIKFVKSALKVTLHYLQERQIKLPPVSLQIHSNLDDASGIKYGLGSSAAVVTAVVASILWKCFQEPPSKALIFKLASIAHVTTQGNGSGADIAASCYGGFLKYTSFQANWLITEYENMSSIRTLVEKDWPYLSIEKFTLPKSIYFYVGWTGKAASTAKLVDEILKLKSKNLGFYQTFLEKSEKAVQLIFHGLKNRDTSSLLKGIEINRRCLKELGTIANVDIETDKLKILIEIAKQYGAAGKPSGAGGGDCGIAFATSNQMGKNLVQAWETAGIKPLNIQSTTEGAQRIEYLA